MDQQNNQSRKKTINTFLKKLSLGGNNTNDRYDDYDEYDDYDDYDDSVESGMRPNQNDYYEEEEDSSRTARKKSSRREIFDDYDEEEEEIPPIRRQTKTKATSKVIPMRKNSNMEVCIFKPTKYEDAKEIADILLSGKAVILNLEGIHMDLAQKIVDFASGATYAIEGNMQKISNYIVLLTPSTVDISGDIPDKILSSTSEDDFTLNAL